MTVTTDLGARVTGDVLVRNLSLVGDEITGTAAKVDVQQVADLARLLTESARVFAAGAGRSGLVLRMAAMRLMHLGERACRRRHHHTGDRCGDLLLVASGSGTTSGVVKSAETAKKSGARVAAFTTNADSPLAALCDAVVIIPAAQKTDHGSNASQQYAGSLFEQVLFVVTDAVFQSLWDHADIQAEELWLRHANLE